MKLALNISTTASQLRLIGTLWCQKMVFHSVSRWMVQETLDDLFSHGSTWNVSKQPQLFLQLLISCGDKYRYKCSLALDFWNWHSCRCLSLRESHVEREAGKHTSSFIWYATAPPHCDRSMLMLDWYFFLRSAMYGTTSRSSCVFLL